MTSYGPSCPQQDLHFVPPKGLDPQTLQFLLALSATGGNGPESEDCTQAFILHISPDLTHDHRLNPECNFAYQWRSQNQVTSCGSELYAMCSVLTRLTVFTVDLWRRVSDWNVHGVISHLSCRGIQIADRRIKLEWRFDRSPFDRARATHRIREYKLQVAFRPPMRYKSALSRQS